MSYAVVLMQKCPLYKEALIPLKKVNSLQNVVLMDVSRLRFEPYTIKKLLKTVKFQV